MEWTNIWKNNNIENNGYKFKNIIRYNKFIEEITKELEIKDNSKILDIGCGDGYVIDYIIKYKNIKNCKIYGIDIINNTNYTKNYSKNYIYHDFHDEFPFKDNYFDTILCISSIFYLKNNNYFIKFIEEIDRISNDNSIIFLGNCMDIEKKKISLEIRNNENRLDSPDHLYISKKYLIDRFKDFNIKITDNNKLNLDFYEGKEYKFNFYINKKNINKINIGIDFHDTLSYNPKFFRNLLLNYKGKRYIITGTPLSKKKSIIEDLDKLKFIKNIHYDAIECGFEYKKEDMNYNHFNKMKIHKLNLIKKNNIKVYFDDNPYYVNFLKDNNITVFQTILSNKYLDIFKNKDKYFCSNLQETQFNFLKDFKLNDNNKIYLPGVFDLFHLGHLMLIKNIKKKYRYKIILGLQSDSSVFKQKNKYPIISFEDRKKFIQNLNLVDLIIEFNNIDQIDILKEYNINYFCIGPEYGIFNEHINTINYCNNNNIKIINTERYPNISTTQIINKIKK